MAKTRSAKLAIVPRPVVESFEVVARPSAALEAFDEPGHDPIEPQEDARTVTLSETTTKTTTVKVNADEVLMTNGETTTEVNRNSIEIMEANGWTVVSLKAKSKPKAKA